jgi:hypothetical protein
VSAETARPTLADGASDTDVRIVTYIDLVKALGTNPLPGFLRSAIVLFDTNFGRVSTQLLAASVGLFKVWLDLAAREEPFNGTAIAISPTPARIWPSDPAGHLHIRLEHDSNLSLVHIPSSGSNFAQSVAKAIRSLAKNEGTIVCMAPLSLTAAIQANLKRGKPFPASIWVLTPGTLDGQWRALSAEDRESSPVQVLFVDPCLRFLQPIPGPCTYLLSMCWSVAGVDPRIQQVVDLDYNCTTTDARLIASLGEDTRREISSIFGVSSTSSVSLTSGVVGFCPAWQQNMAESLMVLVAQLDDEHPKLADVVDCQQLSSPWATESLRRLHVMKLVKAGNEHTTPSLDQCLTLNGVKAGLTVSYLRTGLTRGLGESLLIAEIVSGSSVAVKLTLAAVATACHSDMSVIIESGNTPGTPPTLEECRAGCAGPGAQICHKGRLWVAIGALARIGVLNSDDTPLATGDNHLPVVPVPSLAGRFRNRFRQVLRQASGGLASTPYRFPDHLTEEEVLVVESAIIRSWLPNLTYTFPAPDSGMVARAIEVLSGQDVSFAPCRWGAGLGIASDSRFAVHFGLTRVGDRYTTDTLTLVSNVAVVRVMKELFPTPAGSSMPDYVALLRGK